MKTVRQVQMIEISTILVVNPRSRNTKVHQEITENIAVVGLKRPVIVRPLPPGGPYSFALVCGQGRIESCQLLGQSHVPALVIDTDEETGHVMSLVENIARRTPRASEALEQIGVLRERGYSDAEISRKTGYTTSWVSHVGHLLRHGEKRLLAAVESGQISVDLAVSISRADSSHTQTLLMEAYERGEITGRKVSAVRMMLTRRQSSGKQINHHDPEPGSQGNRHMSAQELVKIYQRQTEEHRLLQRKAEHAEAALRTAREIFKELLANREFISLLRGEGKDTVPRCLVSGASEVEMAL
jgi:ParB family chromosome partitioning protein